MRKKAKKRPLGRIAQPSYMSGSEFRFQCVRIGLETDTQVANFFKIHVRTAASWRLGSQPITAPIAMLLRLMGAHEIPSYKVLRLLK